MTYILFFWRKIRNKKWLFDAHVGNIGNAGKLKSGVVFRNIFLCYYLLFFFKTESKSSICPGGNVWERFIDEIFIRCMNFQTLTIEMKKNVGKVRSWRHVVCLGQAIRTLSSCWFFFFLFFRNRLGGKNRFRFFKK